MWEWFLELHGRRGSNGFGANTLSWTDLHAWVFLVQPLIRLAELRMILALDNSWMAMQAEDALQKEQIRKAKSSPRR